MNKGSTALIAKKCMWWSFTLKEGRSSIHFPSFRIPISSTSSFSLIISRFLRASFFPSHFISLSPPPPRPTAHRACFILIRFFPPSSFLSRPSPNFFRFPSSSSQILRFFQLRISQPGCISQAPPSKSSAFPFLLIFF